MKQTKDILVIIVLILLLLIVGYGFFFLKTKNAAVESLLNRRIQENNITKQWLDDSGKQITESNANYITKSDLKHSDDSVIKALRDGLVTPMNRLTEATKILTTQIAQISMPVRDTTIIQDGMKLQGYTFNYSDPYMPSLKGFLLGDSLHLQYTVKSGFELEHSWQKSGLFKPRELSLVVKSTNPNVRVDKIQTFTIVQEVPWSRRRGVNLAAGAVIGLAVGIATRAPTR